MCRLQGPSPSPKWNGAVRSSVYVTVIWISSTSLAISYKAAATSVCKSLCGCVFWEVFTYLE